MRLQPDPKVHAAANLALRRMQADRRRSAPSDLQSARVAAAHREWRRALNMAALTDDDDIDDVLLAGIVSATEDLRRARAVLRGAGGVA